MNNSTISATKISLGSTVTLTGKATGGTSPYTYAMLYKKKSDTKWTTKQDFKSNATVSIKPANAVEYDVCVKVKDGKGTVEKKFFTLTVTNGLTNTSSISATAISLGSTVTVTCKATGGTAPYQYAVYYKSSSSSTWSTKQDFGTNASVAVKFTGTGTKDICVKVRDNKGNVEKKYFTVCEKIVMITAFYIYG